MESTEQKAPQTSVFKQAVEVLDHRIIILYGGTWSSKTISALQLLSYIGETLKDKVITVIGESVPVLKRTVIRDWQRVVMQERFESHRFNKVELTYQFGRGSLIQFVPADDPDRFLGMRQDYCMIDEASNIKKAIFDQLDIRTRELMILTFNPTHEFWAKEVMLREDCAVIHSTYKDNHHISEQVISTLERRAQTDKNFYDVYVLGKWGVMEGVVLREHENWYLCEELPEDRQWSVFGLDFGFSHDPSALVELVESDGQLWVQELFYIKGMTNQDLAKEMRAIWRELDIQRPMVIADSAEPKSIEEIRRMRINIKPSPKGADSIKHGINLMRQYRINVTKNSINLIKELRNYAYERDRNGELTGRPVDNFNHAIDALRYALMHKKKHRDDGKYAIS